MPSHTAFYRHFYTAHTCTHHFTCLPACYLCHVYRANIVFTTYCHIFILLCLLCTPFVQQAVTLHYHHTVPPPFTTHTHYSTHYCLPPSIFHCHFNILIQTHTLHTGQELLPFSSINHQSVSSSQDYTHTHTCIATIHRSATTFLPALHSPTAIPFACSLPRDYFEPLFHILRFLFCHFLPPSTHLLLSCLPAFLRSWTRLLPARFVSCTPHLPHIGTAPHTAIWEEKELSVIYTTTGIWEDSGTTTTTIPAHHAPKVISVCCSPFLLPFTMLQHGIALPPLLYLQFISSDAWLKVFSKTVCILLLRSAIYLFSVLPA